MRPNFLENLSHDLVTHVTEMCGARGDEWFANLPTEIAELERQWNIRVGDPFPGIEYNFVAEAANDNGRPLVIKIAPPFETVEIYSEAKFLRLSGGNGVVNLIAEDRERKAILIERALPGKALHEAFESSPIECLKPAIDLLESIVQPPPDDMTDVVRLDTWFNNFRRHKETSFSRDKAERAFEIYERLSKQSDKRFYIHGDYHPGNIVTARREPFLAIDPKGIVGHVGYDIAVFLINLERWQRGKIGAYDLLQHAVRRFATAFDMTELEVREWVFAHMVIGAWWNFEDMPNLYDPEVAMPSVWHL
jgi:streptomycin 6-kinase